MLTKDSNLWLFTVQDQAARIYGQWKHQGASIKTIMVQTESSAIETSATGTKLDSQFLKSSGSEPLNFGFSLNKLLTALAMDFMEIVSEESSRPARVHSIEFDSQQSIMIDKLVANLESLKFKLWIWTARRELVAIG